MTDGTDPLHKDRSRVRWARIDPTLPGGIHPPKLRGDIGWDIEAMEDVWIGPTESSDVPVNARLWLPDGWYADIRNRSSMARRGLYIDQNLVDTGYRGPLFVFIRNMALPRLGVSSLRMPQYLRTEAGVQIKAGERIGQLVFHRYQPCWMQEVEAVPLDTERAERAFGSTGS